MAKGQTERGKPESRGGKAPKAKKPESGGKGPGKRGKPGINNRWGDNGTKGTGSAG